MKPALTKMSSRLMVVVLACGSAALDENTSGGMAQTPVERVAGGPGNGSEHPNERATASSLNEPDDLSVLRHGLRMINVTTTPPCHSMLTSLLMGSGSNIVSDNPQKQTQEGGQEPTVNASLPQNAGLLRTIKSWIASPCSQLQKEASRLDNLSKSLLVNLHDYTPDPVTCETDERSRSDDSLKNSTRSSQRDQLFLEAHCSIRQLSTELAQLARCCFASSSAASDGQDTSACKPTAHILKDASYAAVLTVSNSLAAVNNVSHRYVSVSAVQQLRHIFSKLLSWGAFTKFLSKVVEIIASFRQVVQAFRNLLFAFGKQAAASGTISDVMTYSSVVICHALVDDVGPCQAPPAALQSAEQVLPEMLSVAEVPALRVLIGAKKLAMAGETTKDKCYAIDKGSLHLVWRDRVTRSPSPAAAVGGSEKPPPPRGESCLNLTCPPPLVRTLVEKHWSPTMQTVLRQVYGNVTSAFPKSVVKPFNGSLLPCGVGCVTIGFTEDEQSAVRVVVTTSSSLTVSFTFFALVVFYFNKRTVGANIIRRLLIATAVCGALTCSTYLPAASARTDSVVCYDDGTLRIADVFSEGRCALTAFVYTFFLTMAFVYFVCLAHAWYRLVNQLERPRDLLRSRSTRELISTQYKEDFIYGGISVFFASVRVCLLFGLQAYDGLPLYGICSESHSRGYYIRYLTTFYSSACFVGIVILCRGLRQLVYLLVKVEGFRETLNLPSLSRLSNYVRSKTRASCSRPSSTSVQSLPAAIDLNEPRRKQRKSPTDKRLIGLYKLAFQVLFMLLAAVLNAVANIAKSVDLYVGDDLFRNSLKDSLLCRLSTCPPEACPSLPSHSVSGFLIPTIFAHSCVIVLCFWCLSRDLWRNVPLLRWLVRRELAAASCDRSQSSGMVSANGATVATNFDS